MDILKQGDLKQLIEVKDEYCISLYMPTHKTGREQQQDPIRFKNLIAEVEKRLIAYGVNKQQVQKLMRPMETLLSDKSFWQHQSDGLAIFLSPSHFSAYRLPLKFDELMVLGKNFHIKPLLPLLTPNGRFYILAVSLNAIRLFQCKRDTIDEMELSDMPTSMDEALYMDEPEKHLNFHTGTKNPGARGSRPAVFHGQGAQSEEEGKKNILRYFQYVDRGLNDLIEDKSIPMILAGVDYLLPIYHKANHYPYLLKDGLEGNPEEVNTEELLQHSWNLVEPIFNEEQRNAIKQFEQLHGQQSGLVSIDIKTVVKAATLGRVGTLFTPLGVQRWGRFESQSGQVLLEEKPTLKNEDLLNFAVAQTLLNSGQVFALQPKEMPGDGELVAILRYER